MAIGRCVLEALAMKRLAIVSGAKDLKEMITPENVNNAIDANFTGKLQEKEDGTIIPEMKNMNKRELAIKLKEMRNDEIERIVQGNYKIILERLDVNNNSYFIDNPIPKDYSSIVQSLLNNLNNELKTKKETEEIQKELQQECNQLLIRNEEQQDMINSLNEKITIIMHELDAKKKENESILNSKRWEYVTKIADISDKIKRKK